MSVRTNPRRAAQRRRRGPGPLRLALALEARAAAGHFRAASEPTRRAMTSRYERLLALAGVSGVTRNNRVGRFNELLRTSRAPGSVAQQRYRAGAVDVRGGSRAGTATPDESRPVRGTPRGRAHLNFKRHRHLRTADAARARDVAMRAQRQARANARALPNNEPIIIHYDAAPLDEQARDAILAVHFAPGSPVWAVRFGTVQIRNPNPPPVVPEAMAADDPPSIDVQVHLYLWRVSEAVHQLVRDPVAGMAAALSMRAELVQALGRTGRWNQAEAQRLRIALNNLDRRIARAQARPSAPPPPGGATVHPIGSARRRASRPGRPPRRRS